MKEESGKQHKQHLHAALRRHVKRQRVGCKRLRVEGIGGILDGQRPRALIDPRAVENAVVERLQVAERVQFRNKTCERLSNAAHGACSGGRPRSLELYSNQFPLPAVVLFSEPLVEAFLLHVPPV